MSIRGGREMSTIAELEDKVKELMKEIEMLKQEKTEEFEYNFEEFENYWTIGSGGNLYRSMWDNHDLDFERYSQGNVFQTKEEAEREHDKRELLTRFRQFRDKCNGDWNKDNETRNYSIRYDYVSNGLFIATLVVTNGFELFGYFKNSDDATRALELFGDEIKRLFVEVE